MLNRFFHLDELSRFGWFRETLFGTDYFTASFDLFTSNFELDMQSHHLVHFVFYKKVSNSQIGFSDEPDIMTPKTCNFNGHKLALEHILEQSILFITCLYVG